MATDIDSLAAGLDGHVARLGITEDMGKPLRLSFSALTSYRTLSSHQRAPILSPLHLDSTTDSFCTTDQFFPSLFCSSSPEISHLNPVLYVHTFAAYPPPHTAWTLPHALNKTYLKLSSWPLCLWTSIYTSTLYSWHPPAQKIKKLPSFSNGRVHWAGPKKVGTSK
jgi:hypothetical protein